MEGSPRVPQLTLIVPTFNERDNIAPLLQFIVPSLEGVSWEVILVDDDSTDGTAQAVREIAQHDYRVRCLQRMGRSLWPRSCGITAVGAKTAYIEC